MEHKPTGQQQATYPSTHNNEQQQQGGKQQQPVEALSPPSLPPALPPNTQAATCVRQCCDMLALPTRVTCTALTFLHRVESKTAELSPERLAAACIFLAAKVEEANLRTNDMLNAVAAHAADAALGAGAVPPPFCCLVGDAYQAHKCQLILDEQLLLRLLRFDINVDQPHRHLYVLAQCWGASHEAVRMAVCLLNDAICYCSAYGGTTMHPATAAAAALHVGAQLCGQAVQPAGWWRATGITDETMRSSCSALLDLIDA